VAAQADLEEVYSHLIAHNLLRCTMAQAAAEHAVPLERISFKGTLDIWYATGPGDANHARSNASKTNTRA
jgi:hypothetical protein